MSTSDPVDPFPPCRDIVELFTDYLDDAVAGHERAVVEQHLAGCDGCGAALANWRAVVSLAGRLTEADVDVADEVARERLISCVRRLRRR